jgi:hypothetical protein
MDAALRVLRSRLGGYATAARHDSRAINAKARATYRESFREGHDCVVCPRVEIPAGLTDAERDRRGEALRKLHYGRLALRSARRRRRGSRP